MHGLLYEHRRNQPGGGQELCCFDDVHQGLGANYDPAKFITATRVCNMTVAIVACLWLSWVLGANQNCALPTSRAPVPREAETGARNRADFLARVLDSPAAAARRMFDHFLKRRPWELLERQAANRSNRPVATEGPGIPSWARSRVPLTPLAQPHGQN